MRIFCPVWGDAHLQLFSKALARSLKWSKNNQAIKGATWMITSDGNEGIDQAVGIIKSIDDSARTEGMLCKDLANKNQDAGMILIETLKYTVKACIENKEPMLMATPDFIYSDGAIDSFKQLASEPGTCASIAHMRVVPHILGELVFSYQAPRPEQLMDAAFRHPHTSWTNSEAGKKPGMTYRGGVKWWTTHDGPKQKTVAVQHYMPSPFYCNFLPEDLEHFNEFDEGRPPAFGMFDHVWTSHLIKAGRIKFIGSSDIAAMVEITEPHANVPPWNKETDDGFLHKKLHNETFKQFISCFRSYPI